MIVFENKGELDIRAVKIMGISSKDDEKSAIGYFGTGLKYAIAILLRHGATVSLITGGVEYKFDVIKAKVRHDEFDIVTMNGEELGFTTELGKNWELWMAFRELYANTLDEGGKGYETGMFADPDSGSTYVTVQSDEFAKIFNKRDEYFLNTNHDVQAKARNVEFLSKKGTAESNVYLKGVRVMVSRLQGMFDYNFLSGLTLTEDRTVKDSWDLHWELAYAAVQLQDKSLIRALVMANSNTYESSINFAHAISANDMDTFLDVVGELRKKHKDVGVNPTAVKVHKQRRKVSTVLPGISCRLNKVQTEQLDKAVTFCKDVLELELDDYRLIIAKDLGGDGQLGRADIEEGIMYISKQCFKEGTKRVAVAILEEYTHCHHRVEDETVEQKWVYLNQILSLGEQLDGRPL